MTEDYWRAGGGGGAGIGGWGGGHIGNVSAWGGGQGGNVTAWGGGHQYSTGHPRLQQIIKATTAIFLGGSLLVLSGLTLTATVIALTIATPLLVIFSPVLVPAVITVFLLVTGFLASGGFGIAGVSALAWIYRFVIGDHPLGADQLEQARLKLAGKAKDVRDTARDQFGSSGGAHHYSATTTTTSTA